MTVLIRAEDARKKALKIIDSNFKQYLTNSIENGELFLLVEEPYWPSEELLKELGNLGYTIHQDGSALEISW